LFDNLENRHWDVRREPACVAVDENVLAAFTDDENSFFNGDEVILPRLFYCFHRWGGI